MENGTIKVVLNEQDVSKLLGKLFKNVHTLVLPQTY